MSTTSLRKKCETFDQKLPNFPWNVNFLNLNKDKTCLPARIHFSFNALEKRNRFVCPVLLFFLLQPNRICTIFKGSFIKTVFHLIFVTGHFL